MKQQTLAAAGGFERFARQTRRAEFLSQMERVVPWAELVALIEPYYPNGDKGRPPVGLERMLRIYFLQQWFDLSDPAVEDALYDSLTMRNFAGIDLGREPAPDETTVCKVRHLLERHGLGRKMCPRSTAISNVMGSRSAPAPSWTRPCCMRPRRRKTRAGRATRRCTR